MFLVWIKKATDLHQYPWNESFACLSLLCMNQKLLPKTQKQDFVKEVKVYQWWTQSGVIIVMIPTETVLCNSSTT